MRWLIASDIHGSARYCEQLLRRYEEEKADRMLLLGDILYHGPRNDLPEGYAPKEVIQLLNARKQDLLCVRGNCDTEVDQMVLAFPILADYAIFALEEKMIFATHGHHFNGETPPPLHPGDILLQGHTHVPLFDGSGSLLLVNPGSVSIPKNGSPRSYILWENRSLQWKTLDGEVYMSHTV